MCIYTYICIYTHSSVAQLCQTPWTAAHQASMSFTKSQSLLKHMCINQWCHQTISFCHPLFLLPSVFPSIKVFSNELALGIRQSIGVSASVPPVNIQDLFYLRWTGWISLQSQGLSRVFSNTTVQKHRFFSAQFSL